MRGNSTATSGANVNAGSGMRRSSDTLPIAKIKTTIYTLMEGEPVT